MMQSPAGLVMELRSQGWSWTRWGKGRGLLWLETERGTHPGHSETLAVISAGLGRERQLGLLGGGGWGFGGGQGYSCPPACVSRLDPSQCHSVHRVTYCVLTE